MTKKTESVKCPDCEGSIVVDETNLKLGEIVECLECGCEVEIIALNPLRVVELIEEK